LRQRRTFGATVRAGAGFHADQTGRQALENLQHLAAPELASQDRLPFIVDTMQLKNTLRQIDPHRANLVHGWLPSLVTVYSTQCGTLRCRERAPSTPSMAQQGSFLNGDTALGIPVTEAVG
jgi:hypothetical protein